MAAVMTSRQYPSSQPPLPARNHPAQSNVTHVRMGRLPNQSNHSLHTPPQEAAPPPPPSRDHPVRRKSFETASFIDRNTAKAFSDPDRLRPGPTSDSQARGHGAEPHRSQTLPHRRTPKSADDAPPPPPSSLPPKRPPANYERLPPPPASNPPTHRHNSQPTIERLPTPSSASHQPAQRQQSLHGQERQPTPPSSSHQRTQRQQSLPVQGTTVSPQAHTPKVQSPRRQQQSPEMPPQLPARTAKLSTSSISSSESGPPDLPGRPPKTHLNTAHSADDFEKRFRFHEPCDFPEPETSDVTNDKVYPSRTATKKKKPRAAGRDDNLGPL